MQNTYSQTAVILESYTCYGLTLGAHAQRKLQCVSVCVSVGRHLTFGASVCLIPEGQNCGVFFENVPFLLYGVICLSRQRVRPYLVFVATVASLLVRKANNIILNTDY